MKSKNWSEGRCNGADGGDVVVGRAGLGVSVIAKMDDAPTSCA